MHEMHGEKKDDPRRKRVLNALAKGATLEVAAEKAGVNSSTVRRWRQSDPEFAEAVRDAMYDQDDAVEAVTYRNCIDPDAAHNTLRMFWLKSRRPEIYREQVHQHHTGNVALNWPDDRKGSAES